MCVSRSMSCLPLALKYFCCSLVLHLDPLQPSGCVVASRRSKTSKEDCCNNGYAAGYFQLGNCHGSAAWTRSSAAAGCRSMQQGRAGEQAWSEFGSTTRELRSASRRQTPTFNGQPRLGIIPPSPSPSLATEEFFDILTWLCLVQLGSRDQRRFDPRPSAGFARNGAPRRLCQPP